MYLGLSVFYYYMLLLVFSIIHGLITGDFRWDFSILLLFWMAYSIKDGSLTACKWGVFFMSSHGLISLAICFLLLIHPAWIEFRNDIRPAVRPFYFTVGALYAAWSVINLTFLLRILRRRQVRYWTRGVLWGHVALAVVIVCLMIPRIINTAQGYSPAAIETNYAEVIEYLRNAAKKNVPSAINTSEVAALSQAYPDIISASIRTAKKSSYSIISTVDFESFSGFGGRATGIDREGNKIRYVEYEGYTKDNNDCWVMVYLKIRTTK